MASINPISSITTCNDSVAWNQAHDRLQNFFNTFALGDRSQVSRLTLKILDQAREISRQDNSRDPNILVMALTHGLLAEWLEINLECEGRSPQQIFASGYLAMFLSKTFRTAPQAFLVAPLPDDLRRAIREVMVVTGPDLDISSMTSRPVDYGPMRDLANNTWHQWNSRSIFIAALCWAAVYFVVYFWITYFL